MAGKVDKLDMKEAGEKVWIMKLPRFLMDHLEHEAASGRSANLGTVTPAAPSSGGPSSSGASGPAASATYTLTLPEATLPEGLPREYEMRFNARPPATYILSSGASGAPPKHKGRAEERGEIRPRELNATYRNLLRERGERAGIRAEVQTIEDDKQFKHAKLGHREQQKDEKAAREKKVAQRATNAQKRQKPVLSANELQDELLALYTQQSHWTRRDLVARLGNEKALGAVLEKCCDKVTKRGPTFGDYVLKANLRTGLPGSSS